jgi:hypothetical protein
MQLHELDTPCLVIDERRLQHNIARMQRRMDALGVSFRPYARPSKCLDVARRQRDAGACGITVSTLKEAEEFFDGGFDDIFYAVAIAPTKVKRALALQGRGRRVHPVVTRKAPRERAIRQGIPAPAGAGNPSEPTGSENHQQLRRARASCSGKSVRRHRGAQICRMAPRPGLEPGTCGLTVRRSWM